MLEVSSILQLLFSWQCENLTSNGELLIDLFLRTPLDFWRMLAYGVRAVIEVIR